MNFLKVSVALALLACLIFTVVVLIMNERGVEVSDTLIQWFFTVFGVEFASTAAIKIAKYRIKKQETEDKIETLKQNDLPIDKTDIGSPESDEYEYDDNTFYG